MKLFNLTSKKDSFIEKEYEKSMKELRKFFGINWIYNTPAIMLIPNRKTLNKYKREETEPWEVGGTYGKRLIILLNRKNYEKESCHKYSDEEYNSLIKHELCHLFVNIFTKNKNVPVWLNEGICIYLSGQNKFKKPLKKFESFLKFIEKGGVNVYQESGFAVELLINKFGKNKFLKLLGCNFGRKYKNLHVEFKKIYGSNLNYKLFNDLLK